MVVLKCQDSLRSTVVQTPKSAVGSGGTEMSRLQCIVQLHKRPGLLFAAVVLKYQDSWHAMAAQMPKSAVCGGSAEMSS